MSTIKERITEVCLEMRKDLKPMHDVTGMATVLDCTEGSVRYKFNKNSFTFEDAMRLCYFTGRDFNEMARYIFGDEYISKIDSYKTFKFELEKIKQRRRELHDEIEELSRKRDELERKMGYENGLPIQTQSRS